MFYIYLYSIHVFAYSSRRLTRCPMSTTISFYIPAANNARPQSLLLRRASLFLPKSSCYFESHRASDKIEETNLRSKNSSRATRRSDNGRGQNPKNAAGRRDYDNMRRACIRRERRVRQSTSA